MGKTKSFPTILIAEYNIENRDWLVETLQEQGYLVLQAENSSEALHIARIHSRHIHVMLTDGSSHGRTLAAKLQQYRPEMRVLFVAANGTGSVSDLVAPGKALAKVRELVKEPSRTAAAGS